MYGMLSKAPANLAPLLNNQSLKSSSPLDSGEHLCKSWPSSRNEVLLEPTSVLDIRSPSPSSALSPSFAGSCEVAVGSSESGVAAVSRLFYEAASDGQFPDCLSFLDTNDGSVWKVANKRGGEAEDETGFAATVSRFQEEGTIIGNDHSSFVEYISHGHGAGLTGAQQNEEGSSGGMTGASRMIARDARVAVSGRCFSRFQEKQGKSSWSEAGEGGSGSIYRTGNASKLEYLESCSFPSTSFTGSLRFPSSSQQNPNGLSREIKLKEVKNEVLNGRLEACVVSCYNQDSEGAVARVKKPWEGGDVYSGVQFGEGMGVEIDASSLGMTGAAVSKEINQQQQQQRFDAWQGDSAVVSGSEFELGEGERGSSLAMDELESILLESPCPVPDSWILDEREDGAQPKLEELGLSQCKESEGAHHYLLELQDPMEAHQLPNGLFSRSSDHTFFHGFSMLAQAPSVSSFSPHLAPPSFPHLPPDPPPHSQLPLSSSCFPLRAVNVHQLPLPGSFSNVDPSPAAAFTLCPPRASPSEMLQFESKPLAYSPTMLSPPSAEYSPFKSKGMPVETGFPQSSSPYSLNNPMLRNICNTPPMLSRANDKQPGNNIPHHAPSSSSEHSQRTHFFPPPSVPCRFPQQNVLRHSQEGGLQKPIQWQQVKPEPAWQGLMQKGSEEPRPLFMKSSPNQDRLLCLQSRHIQLPELQGLYQWVQRGKVESEEVQPTMVDQLLQAAEAAGLGNTGMAQAILARLNQHFSPQWKPQQRAAFYFKEALAQGIAGSGPLFQSAYSNSPLEIVNKIIAYRSFCEMSPLPQFAHFTANQAILEAMQGENCIHLIDFELGLGGQWASLLEELALQPGPPKLRITTMGCDSMEMQLTKENLNQFARNLNICMEFQSIPVSRLECLTAHMIQPAGEREAIAVNFAFGMNRLLQDFSSADSLFTFLRLVKDLSPRVVTVVDNESEYDESSFFQYFLDSLRFHTLLFDSLESSGASMEAILRVEKLLFAPKIAIGVDGRRRNEKYPHWRKLFQAAGFQPLSFSNAAETQAQCLVPRASRGGFYIGKDQGSLLLGWHGRALVSASAWV